MNCSWVYIPVLLTGFLHALPAQDSAAFPPPRMPCVASVPENAQWIISVSYGKETTESSSANIQVGFQKKSLMEIRVTKTGALKRDLVSYSSGSTEEVWYDDGKMMSRDSNHEIMVFDDKVGDSDTLGDPLRSFGFAGLTWIGLKDYDRVDLYHGTSCYHYRTETMQKPLFKMPTNTSNQTLVSEAWIDVKTHMPVAYTTPSGRLYTYRFLDSPTVPLVLPPDYQAAFAIYKRDQDKMKRIDKAVDSFHRQ
jgi:hypothetical protein